MVEAVDRGKWVVENVDVKTTSCHRLLLFTGYLPSFTKTSVLKVKDKFTTVYP